MNSRKFVKFVREVAVVEHEREQEAEDPDDSGRVDALDPRSPAAWSDSEPV